MPLTPKQHCIVTEYLVDLNATQAALRAGYSARTAPQQSSRLLKNVDVQAAIATKQTHQLKALEVRIEDVLPDLKAIALTDLHVLSEQSGVPARWADKLKALELLMKHLGLRSGDGHIPHAPGGRRRGRAGGQPATTPRWWRPRRGVSVLR